MPGMNGYLLPPLSAHAGAAAGLLWLYRLEMMKARLAHIAAIVTRRSGHPLSLGAAIKGHDVCMQHAEGRYPVPVGEIVGSECQMDDFDAAFRPLRDQMRSRWLGIAQARLKKEPLPPIALIKLNGRYFVRDGHYCLSVARALGAEYVDADVIMWYMAREATAGAAAITTGMEVLNEDAR